jgi:hypothetical protein
MKQIAVLLLAAAVCAPAWSHDYPTVDRVEFVLECLRNNGGAHHYLYKCSCAIDAIAAELPYETYVDSSTVARYQGLGGERSGLFRDSDGVKDLARRYRSAQAQAFAQCGIERKP